MQNGIDLEALGMVEKIAMKAPARKPRTMVRKRRRSSFPIELLYCLFDSDVYFMYLVPIAP